MSALPADVPGGSLSEGRRLRLARLFGADGRCLVLPADHGLMMDRVAGFEDIDRGISRFLEWPVDGFLLSAGLIARYAGALGARRGTALMVTGDSFYLEWGRPGPMSEPPPHEVVCRPSDAVALGADVLKLVFFADAVRAARMAEVRLVAECIATAHGVGLPVVVEPLVASAVDASERAVLVEGACRLSAELGVDLLKCEYPGTPAGMRRIVEEINLPVVILGGALAGSSDELLRTVGGALEGGAAGVVIGRNIWQRPAREADKLVARIAALVHGES